MKGMERATPTGHAGGSGAKDRDRMSPGRHPDAVPVGGVVNPPTCGDRGRAYRNRRWSARMLTPRMRAAAGLSPPVSSSTRRT